MIQKSIFKAPIHTFYVADTLGIVAIIQVEILDKPQAVLITQIESG